MQLGSSSSCATLSLVSISLATLVATMVTCQSLYREHKKIIVEFPDSSSYIEESQISIRRAILVVSGDLGSRMRTLCGSHVLTQAAKLSLAVDWVSDQWLPATDFTDLFKESDTWIKVSKSLGEISMAAAGWIPLKSAIRLAASTSCSAALVISDWPLFEQAIPDSLHLHSHIDTCRMLRETKLGKLLAGDGCQLARGVHLCYQTKLSLSQAVMNLVSSSSSTSSAASTSPLSQEQLRDSHGVFMQAGRPFAPPALSLSQCFPTSSPASSSPVTESSCWGPAVSHWGHQANFSSRAMLMSLLRSANDVRFVIGGGPREAVEGAMWALHPDKAPVRLLGFDSGEHQVLCEGSGSGMEGSSGPQFTRLQAQETDVSKRKLLSSCAQRQLAEMVLLSHTRLVIHGFPSGAADFIAARAELVSAGRFQRQLALCQQPRVPLVVRQRWAEQTYVDGSLLQCSDLLSFTY